MVDFDVIVIGGGSAGTAAAREAARAGARTALVNDGELGGLCILRGCMPTKAMLASAHGVHEARRLDGLGVRLEGRVTPDFARIQERKNEQVARFQRAKIRSVDSEPYEVIFGRARFTPDGLRVGDSTLRARRYVIATGSFPIRLPIPGIDDVPVLTSDDVMRLETPPRRLLVHGAGPIGLELAQFFARIGTRVQLVNRSPLLSRLDPEAGQELARALGEEFALAVPGRILALRRRGGGLAATVETGGGRSEHEADALLCATGRAAALDDLGLEHVGLQPRGGRIEHDAAMRTSHPEIYVAGDATGRHQVLHIANQEGTVAGHNAATGDAERVMDYRLRMSVVFTDPPYAHVGRTEAEAEREGIAVVTGRARFPDTGRAITMGVRHGLWKLTVERATCEIVGSSIVGPRADDLIHLVAILMHQRAPASAITELPWYHPTLSEVMLNLERDLASRMNGCPEPVLPPA